MSGVYDEAAAAFAEVHSEGNLGEDCTVGETAGKGVFGAEVADYTFADASQREGVIREGALLKANWSRPANRSVVVIGSNTYVVTSVREDAVHYLLTLQKRT